MIINLLIKFCLKFPVNLLIENKHSLTNSDKYLLDKYDLHYSQRFLGSFVISIILSSTILIFTILSKYFFIAFFILLFFIFRFIMNMFENYVNEISSQLNSIMFLIQNNFNLILEIIPNNSNLTYYLVKLIYTITPNPIKQDFKEILLDFQRGNNIENLLLKYESPSENFNKYIKNLISSNFHSQNYLFERKELENEFKVLNRTLDTKISIFFFIGVFFPIGLNFMLLFHIFSVYWIFLFIIIYFVILNYLSKNVINKTTKLIGVSTNNLKRDEEYKLTLELLINITYWLKYLNAENAFIESYKISSYKLKKFIKEEIHMLKIYSYSLETFLYKILEKIKDNRNKLLFLTFSQMIREDPYKTAEQLDRILVTLKDHMNLQIERENIIKSESIKGKIFEILLPLINGLMLGIFIIIFNLISDSMLSFHANNLLFIRVFNNIEIFIIIINEFFMVILCSFYINKIINNKYHVIHFILISIIFFISIFFSIIYSLNISNQFL
ncbi:MAG: hypothetical protein ACTSRZ_00335 [Promethearchaeota archaeon]